MVTHSVIVTRDTNPTNALRKAFNRFGEIVQEADAVDVLSVPCECALEEGVHYHLSFTASTQKPRRARR